MLIAAGHYKDRLQRGGGRRRCHGK